MNKTVAKFQRLVGGYRIPSIGLGSFAVQEEEQLENAIDIALETGYRHIDTAYVYGNEHIIGRTLKKWFDSGKLKREDLFITTKLSPSGNTAELVEFFLNKSLAALQLDYVDLYLIHFPIAQKFTEAPVFPTESIPTDHISLWKKMEEQVDNGKALRIGVSNFNIRQIENILKSCRIQPACLQVEIHPYLQQKELREFCHKHDIVVTGYANLGRPGVNDYYKKNGLPPVKLPALLEDETIKRIATKHNKSPAQVILRYLLQKNVVVIPKSVTPKRIKDNFDIFNFYLDALDVKMMENLERGEEERIAQFRVGDHVVNHLEYPF